MCLALENESKIRPRKMVRSKIESLLLNRKTRTRDIARRRIKESSIKKTPGSHDWRIGIGSTGTTDPFPHHQRAGRPE